MIDRLDSEAYGLHDKLHLFLELCLGRIRNQIVDARKEVQNARTEAVGCGNPKIACFRDWREQRRAMRVLGLCQNKLSSLELEEAKYDHAARKLLVGSIDHAVKLLDKLARGLPGNDNYWAPVDVDAVRIDELKAFARRVYKLMSAQPNQGS